MSGKAQDRDLGMIRVLIACAVLVAASPSASSAQCIGDCMGDGGVSVDELLTGVNIAIGRSDLLSCPAFDDGSGVVRVSTVVAAVNNALQGCAAALPSWKQPGYAATHDAHNPTEEVITASNVAALTEIWRHQNVGIDIAPVVAAARIFTKFAAGGCGSPDCAPIDSFELDAPIAGQPVVAGDVLYAGTEKGTILAFDAFGCDEAPCRPLWAVDTQGGGITAGPIVTGGMLFATNSGGTLFAYGLPSAIPRR